MENRFNYKLKKRTRKSLALICLGLACDLTYADDNIDAAKTEALNDQALHLSGYVRTWASFNLQNPPETKQNDKGDLSMLRSSLSLNLDTKTGPIQWKAIGRLDREYETDYLRRLQAQNQTNNPGGPGSSIMNLYNQAELREFYADFDPTERIHLRIGRQQVVWGETDFFHATDLINGYDYRWRSFLERDNDELRKPLNMVSAKIDVPEANGSLQVVIRPGLDRNVDIGSTYDLSGGRWAEQPNKGVDFLAPGALTMNYKHPDGNSKDVTGGARWTGSVGDTNYSVSYLKTFNPNPVVNSSFVPYKVAPVGGLGDFIYTKIDVIGASVSTQVTPIEGVFGTEVAYQKSVPYNVGTHFLGGALPGFGGIVKKDAVVTSLRFDKQFRLMNLLGTNAPSFASIQLFNTWIKDFKNSDDLVALAGFGAPVKKNTTMLTGFITLNYSNSTINPGLAAGADISAGDVFVIPSVEFKWGNHWRLVAEADLFFPRHSKAPGQIETSSYPIGNFDNNDQLMLRLSYQF